MADEQIPPTREDRRRASGPKRGVLAGDEIRRLRARLDLTQGEFAALVSQSLGRSYTNSAVGHWEAETRAPPKDVGAFLAQLSLSQAMGDSPPPLGDEQPPPDAGQDDSAPGPGPDLTAQPKITSSGMYAKACEELWELIATGLGMVGAGIGSQALMNDGAIIAADRKALGAAWGRLAETNDTFRKMLVSMTEGGAWLQVAVVTGTTVSKCWQNHAQMAAHLAQQAEQNGHVADEQTAAV